MSQAADFPTQHGAQFSVGHLGPFAELLNYRFSVPALNGREVPGKVFVPPSNDKIWLKIFDAQSVRLSFSPYSSIK